MKYLKLYESIKDKNEIYTWLENFYNKTSSRVSSNTYMNNFTINDDYSITSNNDIHITNYIKSLRGEALPYKFRFVMGKFKCNGLDLTSLKNAPEIVVDDFDCSYNNLTSLEGGPRKTHNYICSNNNLKNLKGIGRFNFLDCSNNNITHLNDVDLDVVDRTDIKGNPIDDLYSYLKSFKQIGLVSMHSILERKKLIFRCLKEYNVINGNVIVLDSLKEALFNINENYEKRFNIEKLLEMKDYEVLR